MFVSAEKPEATLRMPGPTAPLRVHVPGGGGRWLRLVAEEGENYRGTRALKLDADGRIEVSDLPPGTYGLWVPPTQEATTCAFRRGVDPSAGPVELTLEPGRTIRARVKVPAGTKHVEVSVLGPLEQPLGTEEAEPGLHEARGLPTGTWTVSVKARAPNAWIYAKTQVAAGGEVELEPKPR